MSRTYAANPTDQPRRSAARISARITELHIHDHSVIYDFDSVRPNVSHPLLVEPLAGCAALWYMA
jgi:hypothetical protein